MDSEPLWLPGTYTRPLSDDFPSAGDKLIRLVELAWKSPEYPKGLTLDPWQEWLLRHVLERYPEDHPKYPGQLRYRQVVVSMGRQNGKSVLGAIFGLYGLLQHTAGPHVISVASTAEQARIIYDRVLYVIQKNGTLGKRFKKTTETRGIVTKDGAGRYEIKASKGDALQGLPISLGLYDEIHITKPEMWSAMVLGTAQRENGLVLGITTAGDDDSTLLKNLYEKGRRAAGGDPELERFGFFLWEAPAGSAVDAPDALIAANPSLASGRMDLETTQADVRTLPEADARRYRLNQFVASEGAWLPMGHWYAAANGGIPAGARVTFTVDRTPEWSYAAVTASAKVDGVIYTELVASLVNPTPDSLTRVCVALSKHGPNRFVVDSYTLKDLAKELKVRGLPVLEMSLKDVTTACSLAYARIAQGKVSHPGDDLVSFQMPRAVRKNAGDAWRISRQSSSSEIDAVMSTVMGIYVAETVKEDAIQIF